MGRNLLLLCVALCAVPTRGFDFDDDEEVASSSGQSAWFAADSEGMSVMLQHAIGDDQPPTPRGKLHFKAPKTSGRVAVRVAQARLEGEAVDAIKALAKSGGVYTISLPSVLSDPDSPPVFASTSACALLASRFEEHLQLTMDGKDRVVALSYYLPVVPPRCPTEGLPRLALDEVLFKTSATQHFPEEGARPMGKLHDASFLPAAASAAAAAAQRAAMGAEGKEGEQPAAENQSFLRKYWMYILPVVLIMSMGGPEPEGDGQGGGSGGARPAAGAARPPH